MPTPLLVPTLRTLALTCGAALLASCATVETPRPADPIHDLVPAPTSLEWTGGTPFEVTDSTPVVYDEGDGEGRRVAMFLAELVGSAPESALPVSAEPAGTAAARGAIRITRAAAGSTLGPEAYELEVTDSSATLVASDGAGLFYAAQTLRQLLPVRVEYTAAYARTLPVQTVRVADGPRFGWRGAMLDVSRHFLTPEDVKRFIDLMVPYKLNRLHLHLSDDQGWRIEIPGWPDLTRIGGSTEVGGGPGGFYTLAEYADLVRYADERFVTIVPEIDVPGHTNAALASYAELNCDGVAPELYTGREVGFSALCPGKRITYEFLDDVIGAIASATTGPWFHIGGDEVRRLTDTEYRDFIARVQGIVGAHGKQVIAWDEAAAADLGPEALVQLWRPLWVAPGSELPDGLADAAASLRAEVDTALSAGARMILSPADRMYLDMKYDEDTAIGLTWAGRTSLRTAYAWDPADLFHGIPESAIAGVEATLWSETLGNLDDVEYMAFPRLAAVAEVGWTARSARSWSGFRYRVASHGARWQAMGVNFRRASGVDWPR